MATKKGLGKGLGKGLDSIIVDKLEGQEVEIDVSRETMLNINLVEPNRKQPRSHFEEDKLEELAESIRLHGIIQPLIVQKKDDHYEIIAGERRWRASRLAGLKEVPVVVKEYSDREVLEIALIENIQREDLNPIEEAAAYERLIREYELKQDEVAERVSKSRVAVTNALRLLKLSPEVQEMLIDDKLSVGHARALLALKDEDMQLKVANRVFDEKLTVREVERLVKQLTKEKAEKPIQKPLSNEAIYRDLEEQLKQRMGSKVSIKRKSEQKGTIEIEYYSVDELDRIVGMLQK